MATKLARTGTSSTNATKFTWSAWVKKSSSGTTQNFLANYLNGDNEAQLRFLDNEKLYYYDRNGGNTQAEVTTTAVYRDCNAWYHICLIGDTTDGTQGDRIQLYVNGVRQTMTGTYPDANDSLGMKVATGTNQHAIGTSGDSTSNPFSGIISHVHYVDGIDYPATTFGSTDSTTGEWKINTSPSISTSDYGNNGYFILKDTNSGTDQSGNSHNLTVTSGTLTKTEDCPSNVFATLNVLATSSYASLTQGNNTVKGNNNANDGETYSTLGTSNSGKYYWEIKATGVNSLGNPKLGFVQSNRTSVMRLQNGGSGLGGAENGSLDIMVRPDAKVLENGSTSSVLYNTFSAGNILSFALDSDNGAFYYAINGTWQNSGNPASGASKTGAIKTWTPTDAKASGGQHVCIGSYETASQSDCNFGNGYFGTTAVSSAGTNASGNGIFEYDVPTGYTALSTKGLNL